MKTARVETMPRETRMWGRMSGRDLGGVEGKMASWREVRRSSREEMYGEM